jgi:hypothetical protein
VEPTPAFGSGAMNIVYFISSQFDYASAIYPGVGAPVGRSLGWQVETIDNMAATSCEVGVVDNRLTPVDVANLEQFLSKPASARFPLFFRVSDPDMPRYHSEPVKFIFRCRDEPGIHYASVYEPAGPLGTFLDSMSVSRVALLPYAYEIEREVDRVMAQRKRRIFFSGKRGRGLYPLRATLERKRRFNPLVRLIVADLPHPGYPESGRPQAHSIVGRRYIQHAAGFTHFFLCPSRYGCELMKYLECAYAGCAPTGQPAHAVSDSAGACFFPYSGRTSELFRAVFCDLKETNTRAIRYREIMRELRHPQKIVKDFVDQIHALI